MKHLRYYLAAGGGLAWAAIVGVLYSNLPKHGAGAQGWVRLEGDHVTLRRGVRYRGCIDLPFVVGKWMVRDKLVPGLEKKGFVNVRVAEARPPAWPEASCDFYVEATWNKDEEKLERPGAVSVAWAQT